MDEVVTITEEGHLGDHELIKAAQEIAFNYEESGSHLYDVSLADFAEAAEAFLTALNVKVVRKDA